MRLLVTSLIFSTLGILVLGNELREKLFFLQHPSGEENETLLVVTWDDEDEMPAGCEVFSDEKLIKEVLKSSADKSIRPATEDDMQHLLQECTEITLRRRRRQSGDYNDSHYPPSRNGNSRDTGNRGGNSRDWSDREGNSGGAFNRDGSSRSMPDRDSGPRDMGNREGNSRNYSDRDGGSRGEDSRYPPNQGSNSRNMNNRNGSSQNNRDFGGRDGSSRGSSNENGNSRYTPNRDSNSRDMNNRNCSSRNLDDREGRRVNSKEDNDQSIPVNSSNERRASGDKENATSEKTTTERERNSSNRNEISDESETTTVSEGLEAPATEASTQWPIIWPGTKWCGSGDIAKNYDDLGLHQDTDRCCRAHDLCNETLLAGQTRHNLTNKSPFTKLSCKCDNDFYTCLDRVNSLTSNTIGNLYFNILKRECYKEDHPLTKKCKKYKTFLKISCKEYEKDTSAKKVFQWFPAKRYKKIPFPGPLTVTLPF